MPEGRESRSPGIGGADGLDILLDGGDVLLDGDDALLDVRKSWRRPTGPEGVAKILNRRGPAAEPIQNKPSPFRWPTCR